MKNFLFLAILFTLVGSSNSFAKEAQKRKVLVISFTESDSKNRMPSSVSEKAVMAAQARHVAQASDLDRALENLN